MRQRPKRHHRAGSALVPFFSWKSGKYPLFLLSLVLSFGLMFVTGTKFTFYSIFIVAGAFIFLFVLNFQKKSLRYVLPLLAVLVLVVAFRQYAPMQQRERTVCLRAEQLSAARVEESLKNTGADQEELEAIKEELEQSGSGGGSTVGGRGAPSAPAGQLNGGLHRPGGLWPRV